MKQLIKELIYRTMYTLFALSILIGFIYLNYASQIEYMWYVYIMDSECIDFCWFESINQGHSRQGQAILTSFSTSHHSLLCEAKFEHFPNNSVGLVANHSIAHNHGLFLTLVSVFISHESQLYLKLEHVAMLAWYPFIIMILFQNVAFWLPAMLGLNVLNVIAINHIFLFILWVHKISLPTGILFYKEFQIEPSDSELFASGLYIMNNENMAQVYFVWLIGLCILFYAFAFFFCQLAKSKHQL